jgi:UDP-N-acetylglucosamine--N-acetylmuramyl-(pentapeptide) pyrophosphoryl-undecaprenol N-acetylglucosamine transferase
MNYDRSFFFAGGGTGGHVYPAVAVAEKLVQLEPNVKIHFFCSNRDIDTQILERTGFSFTKLPAKGFSVRPMQAFSFCASFFESYRVSKYVINANDKATVIGIGGFVAAPVCLVAYKLNVPIKLINVDILPGRANKIIARWADEIFLQFQETQKYLPKYSHKIKVVGCPLRSGFENLQPNKVISQLGLEENKKTLLITGASSGSANINNAVCTLLERLEGFADEWQIVHITGTANYELIKNKYNNVKIRHTILGYFNDMPDLLAASDLVVGRSGAVSVAEYAAANVPSICLPYPYHKDRHQYLNAGKLVEAGAAVIVNDSPDVKERAESLWRELKELMENDKKRQQMKKSCKGISRTDGALKIAQAFLEDN